MPAHRSRRTAALVALALAAPPTVLAGTTAASAAAPATARVAQVTMADPAPPLRTWFGKVVKVRDGDTVEVDIKGDGTSKPIAIRNAGIQAMSLAKGSFTGEDECHAREARARLTKLTLGKKVRTQSYFTLRDIHGRYNRYVDVLNPATGKYDIDVQKLLLLEGHALWLAQTPETARMDAYHTYAQQGMATGRNLYDPDYCAPGPAQSVPLKMWINYDADGDDADNINGEWVRIQNTGTSPVNMSDFYLRRAKRVLNTHFLSSLVLQPGQVLTVHMGTGTASGLAHYWGGTEPMLANLDDPVFPGSAAYLYDADGDIRARAIYPCTYQCSDPNAGRLALTEVVSDAPGDDSVTYAAEDGERITVTNTSTGTVDLTSYVLATAGNTFELPSGVQLGAGQSAVVHVGPGTPRTDASGTRHLYWGRDQATLGDSAGWLELRAWNGFRIDCVQWGAEACPPPA